MAYLLNTAGLAFVASFKNVKLFISSLTLRLIVKIFISSLTLRLIAGY